MSNLFIFDLVDSCLISAKFFDDEFYNNAFYAKLGGVPAWEMNALELEFLHLVRMIYINIYFVFHFILSTSNYNLTILFFSISIFFLD